MEARITSRFAGDRNHSKAVQPMSRQLSQVNEHAQRLRELFEQAQDEFASVAE
jgi:hypothetical protein